MLINVASEYNSSRMAAGFARNTRGKIFRKVESFSLAEFDKIGTASLITRTTNDVTQIQNYLVFFVRILIRAPIMMVGGVIMAFRSDPSLSMPLMVSIPLIAALVVIVSRWVVPLSEELQKKIDKVNLVLREKLSGIRVIRAFGTEDYEEERFDGVNRELMNSNLRLMRMTALMMPALMIVTHMTTIVVVWVGAVQVNLGDGLMVGDIIAIIQYVMQIMFSLIMLSMVFIQYPRAAASAARINEVLQMPASVLDPHAPVPELALRATVEFRDVSFTFPGAERSALQHISFVSGPGEITAIVGSTGSGKSSLLNLVPRLYDVTGGQVLVNGVDVRDYKQQKLRTKLGYVPQRATLFSGTVASNIRMGSEDIDDQAVQSAALTAQVLDFVETREGGFDSEIARGGTNLSGGQKQRLSIARAVARDPDIYLFDDSFSALDYQTDARLRSALRKKTDHATILLVAQRISTVLHADRILVLDNGELAGVGTHAELMKTCVVYREIVSSQFSDEEVTE